MFRAKIAKPLAFTFTFVGTTFAAASYIRSETIWKEAQQQWNPHDLFSRMFPRNTSPIIHKEGILEQISPRFLLNIRDILLRKWDNALPAERLGWCIIGLNTIVFGAWQVPSLARFMNRHFVHRTWSGIHYTMITSTFSHESFLHFAFNMMALNSFFASFQYRGNLSIEQTSFFYLGAGCVSAFGSHIYSVLTHSPKASLGASGAIWALLAGSAFYSPESRIGFVFLPGISFTMEQLVPALVLIDVAGLVLKWKTFDHAAHLAGATFGLWYCNYGTQIWLETQKVLYDMRRSSNR